MFAYFFDWHISPERQHCNPVDAMRAENEILLAGKTSIVRALALLCNQQLVEVALTAGSDTSDILGGFEQIEPARKLQV